MVTLHSYPQETPTLMSTVSIKPRSFIALPLTLAVSTLLVSACSSAPVKNTTNLPTVRSVGQQPITQQPVGQQPITQPAVTPMRDYSVSYLDAESLDELADLLEATDMSMVEDNKLAIQQYGDLWDRLRAGYGISRGQQTYNPRIDAQKSWFTSRQDYLNRLTARSSRYLYHTVREAERRNIPTELALLPVIESSYDPSATSSAAAAGLWQFIPSTGRIYGLSQSSTYDARRDVIESTRAAYDFLTTLHNQFGSWELALASYNAGPGRIQRAIDVNASQGLPTDFWSLSLPTETMNYVPRFLAVAEIVAKPEQYGVYLPAIANRQHFRSVPVNYGVSLAEVSQTTGVSFDELQKLNTALISARVDSSGPQRVVIPNDVSLNIDARLSSLQGNGTSNILANSATTVPSYNIPYDSSLSLPTTGSGLADFAASASVPQQTINYIPTTNAQNSSPVLYGNSSFISTEPSITSAETNKINAEFKNSNSLPTTSAQITPNNTITQEPPLTTEERDFIASQIRAQTSETNVVSSIDGNIRLSAVQTQQSILEASGQPKRLSFASSSASQLKPEGTRTIYIVKPGDTLSSIASRSGLSWRDIAEWNQIDSSATLLSGSNLYLYNARPMDSVSATTANINTNTNTRPRQSESYIVQSGDTLIGTANRFGLSVTQLATYNNLSTQSELLINQKLWLIPGKVKVTTPVSTSVAPSTKPSKPSSNSSVTSDYKVKSGDTLIGIADSLGVSAAEIAAINSSFGATARLQSGQIIKVPVSKSQADRKLSDKPISYKIQSGDTLTGISQRYNIGISELASANDLASNSNLIAGRTLNIPASGSSSSSATTQSKTNSSRTTSTSNTSTGKVFSSTEDYKVQAGDSLIALARRFGVSVDDLAATNNMASNGQLQRGKTIKVPKLTVSYTVGSGDNLIGLARKYGVSTQELADMNDIAADAKLQRGQRLTVPNR